MVSQPRSSSFHLLLPPLPLHPASHIQRSRIKPHLSTEGLALVVKVLALVGDMLDAKPVLRFGLARMKIMLVALQHLEVVYEVVAVDAVQPIAVSVPGYLPQ